MTTTRRDFLGMAAGAFAVAGLPHAVFAAAPGDRRLVVVLLRGAMDGLAAVPPIGDPHYAEKRGAIALAAESCIPLDNGFALNPGPQSARALLPPGRAAARAGVGQWLSHALAFRRPGSDGMRPRAKTRESDGWLNRALALIQPASNRSNDKRLGLAVGGAVPLLLRGAVPVASWEPAGVKTADADFVTALGPLYAHDALFGPALQLGLKTQNFSDTVLGDNAPKGPGGFGPKAFAPLAGAAGKLLAAEDGPRIAALEMLGWDTHVAQGTTQGRLYENLAGLAAGFDALAQNLGAGVEEHGGDRDHRIRPHRRGQRHQRHGSRHGHGDVRARRRGQRRRASTAIGRASRSSTTIAISASRRIRAASPKAFCAITSASTAASINAKVFPDAASLKPAEGLLRA